MGEPIIEIQDVVVRYGAQTVLAVDTLRLHPREVLAVVGPNGSGKSTLLKILALLEPPSQGRIWFDGEPVVYRPRRLLALRRRIAVVLQEALLCHTTVYHNVALGLRFRGLAGREIKRRVHHWLERLGILHLRDRQAGGVSGGEAQRTSLARALALEPDLLLLDEPFSALDVPTRATLLTEFQSILAQTQMTAVFVTHDRGEAMVLGDRIATLLNGQLAQIGTPEAIFTRPVNEAMARFVGMETLIPGQVASASDGWLGVHTVCGLLHVPGNWAVGDAVYLCLRPEDVTLVEGETIPSAMDGVLSGQVTKIVPSDAQMRIEVDCGIPVVALVLKPWFRDVHLEQGQKVLVAFPSASVHVIRREK